LQLNIFPELKRPKWPKKAKVAKKAKKAKKPSKRIVGQATANFKMLI
jgi:hypothetical protein